jgi:hypothetical protein
VDGTLAVEPGNEMRDSLNVLANPIPRFMATPKWNGLSAWIAKPLGDGYEPEIRRRRL